MAAMLPRWWNTGPGYTIAYKCIIYCTSVVCIVTSRNVQFQILLYYDDVEWMYYSSLWVTSPTVNTNCVNFLYPRPFIQMTMVAAMLPKVLSVLSSMVLLEEKGKPRAIEGLIKNLRQLYIILIYTTINVCSNCN